MIANLLSKVLSSIKNYGIVIPKIKVFVLMIMPENKHLRKLIEKNRLLFRLRQPFTTVLSGLDPKKFIEALEPRTLRFFTHSSLVTYYKDCLLRHDNEKVRKLVRRLP